MGPDALAAAEPVLAALRRWRPVYARWAYHPCASAGCPPPPWSPTDEERLAALRALAPDVVAGAAAGWRRLASALGHSGDSLTSEFGHRGDPPTSALGRAGDPPISLPRADADPDARRLAELTARMTERAGRADTCADSLDLLAQRLDAALAEFTTRLARLAAPLATGGYASPRAALEDIEVADDVARVADARWPDLDELVTRHGGALVTLRAGIDELLELARRPAAPDLWPPPAGLPDGWCTSSSGCRSSAAAEDPLREWQPLPPRVNLETGPALPSTQARRVDPEIGGYLPLLPDGPPPPASPPQ